MEAGENIKIDKIKSWGDLWDVFKAWKTLEKEDVDKKFFIRDLMESIPEGDYKLDIKVENLKFTIEGLYNYYFKKKNCKDIKEVFNKEINNFEYNIDYIDLNKGIIKIYIINAFGKGEDWRYNFNVYVDIINKRIEKITQDVLENNQWIEKEKIINDSEDFITLYKIIYLLEAGLIKEEINQIIEDLLEFDD